MRTRGEHVNDHEAKSGSIATNDSTLRWTNSDPCRRNRLRRLRIACFVRLGIYVGTRSFLAVVRDLFPVLRHEVSGSLEQGKCGHARTWGAERRIQFDEIASVKKEVSSAGDVLAQSRPFSRIAVYPNRDPGGFVDISLRHFKLEDVEELLAAIRKRRPDLSVPGTSINCASGEAGPRV